MADKQLWEVLPQANNVENDDGVLIGGSTAGTRFAPLTLIANFVHNLWAAFINSITPLKTSFASGDKIPIVNGNTATAMEKDTLLSLAAQNAVDSCVALRNTGATQSSFEDKIVRDIVTTDGNDNQTNINLFEQIIPIAASDNQLFNKDGSIIYSAYPSNLHTLVGGADFRTVMFRVPPGAKYCISLPTGEYTRFVVRKASSFKNIGDGDLLEVSTMSTENGRDYFVATMSSSETYLLVYYYNANSDSVDESVIRGKIEVCIGDHPVAYQNYQLKCLSFNGFTPLSLSELNALISTKVDKAVSDNAYNYQYVHSVFDGTLISITEDVSSSYDFSENSGKYIATNGAMLTDAFRKVSELIQIPENDRFVLAIFGVSSGMVAIAYYDDAEGSHFVSYDAAKSPSTGHCYVVMPNKNYKSFRVVSGVDNVVGMYKFDYSSKDLTDAINAKFGQVHEGDRIVIDTDVTTNYPLSNLLKGIGSNGQLTTTSAGGCTNVIQIDRTKKLCLDCKMNQYITAVAFYKDAGGQVLDSLHSVPLSATSYTDLVIDFPVTARSFRLGTTDTSVYAVKTYHYVAASGSDVSDRVSTLESEVASLIGAVAELAESAFLATTIDTINAVKFKPNSVVYLGADLFDFTKLSYNSSYWSVDSVNGTIEYLGGSYDPIVLEVSTSSGESYALECEQSNYIYQTNTLLIGIGNGPKIDAYNGTDNLFVGAVSDGGYLKIYPMMVTNPFKLSNLAFRKKVSQGDAVKTINYNPNNVNSGNSDSTALDAKWNVALGPTGFTQPAAVSLTRSIAIGIYAQRLMQCGWQNIAIGTFAQNLLKYGDRNIALGCDCLYAVTHSDDTIAIGKGTISGNPASVNWSNPATYNKTTKVVAIGNGAARIQDGQSVEKSTIVGDSACKAGLGSKCTAFGADIGGMSNKTNSTAVGYGAECDKSNQAVFGNSETTETKVFGDFIVSGTDNVKRKIVFNNDNTCSWEVVS